MEEQDITIEDLLDELAANVTPTRQPGDVDCAQLAAKINRSTNTARKRMDEEAKTASWELLTVYDPEVGRDRLVVRRVAPSY